MPQLSNKYIILDNIYVLAKQTTPKKPTKTNRRKLLKNTKSHQKCAHHHYSVH